MANHIVDLGISHNENCFVSDIFKGIICSKKTEIMKSVIK